MNSYRRLAAVHVVLPSAIRHEADLIDDVQEVLNDVQCDLGKGALRTQETLNNPEGIPVVWLSETSTSNDERTVHRDERTDTARAVSSTDILAGEIWPDANDLLNEVANGRAVDMIQECRVGSKLVGGDGGEFRASLAKVFRQEIVQLSVIAQRFGQVLESGNDFVDRASRGTRRNGQYRVQNACSCLFQTYRST